MFLNPKECKKKLSISENENNALEEKLSSCNTEKESKESEVGNLRIKCCPIINQIYALILTLNDTI